MSWAAVVHLNLRAGSTFPGPGHSIGLAGAPRLTRSDFMLHIGADLLLYFIMKNALQRDQFHEEEGGGS